MKRFLALFLAMLLLLSGCAGNTQTTEQTVSAPVSGTEDAPKDIRLAVETAAGFDPYHCQSTCNRLVLELVLQPLFTVSATGEAMPVLAKGWSVSPDGMTTTVYLREDVVFHDGRPLTAGEVVSSVEKAKNGTYYAGRFRYVTEVTAPNAVTAVFKTEKPYECLPRLLDIPIVTGSGPRPVGTGPYRFAGANGLRRASQWQEEYPCPAEEIAFVPVSGAMELRDGFQYSGISAAMLDPNEPSALAYNGEHALWSVPTSILQYVGFNLRSGPFADGGLRSAVTYAIDREAIVLEDMGGAAVAAPTGTLPGWDTYSADLAAKVTYTPKKLRDLGWQTPEGVTYTMLVSEPGSQRNRSAQRIADALNDCGIAVTVKALRQEEFRTAMYNGEYDLYYTEVRLPSDLDLSVLFEDLGYGGLRSQEGIGALCDLTRANAGNAYDLQRAILMDGLICPIAFKQMELYIHRDVLQGVSPKLGGWILQ